jgi:hypothetical protein
MIGNQGLAADDHIIRIGDVQTQTFIAGISGINVSGVPVLVSSSGQLGIAQSSRRFKEDIQDMGADSHGLLRLRPVTFRYKQPIGPLRAVTVECRAGAAECLITVPISNSGHRDRLAVARSSALPLQDYLRRGH